MATTTPKTRDEQRPDSGSFMDKAKDAAGHAVDKAKDVAGQAADKAKDVGSNLLDKAKTAAGAVGDAVSGAASSVGHKADDWTSSAGSSLKNLGDTMQKKAPHDGLVGNAAQTVARGIKQGGEYIEEEGLSGMADDLSNLIRRNPVPAVLIGIGIGFLIGRTLGS